MGIQEVIQSPFPRTWSEELISEWLQLEGYFVESGVPIRSGLKGGRFEADIIGIRGRGDRPEISHIEVGSLPENPKKSADMIERKFSVENEEAVKRYCRDKLGLASTTPMTYNRLYVAVWGSDRAMSYLERQKLPVMYLEDLIKNRIKPTIRQWKENPPHRPQTRGKSITLPENMWLLDLLDYISE